MSEAGESPKIKQFPTPISEYESNPTTLAAREYARKTGKQLMHTHMLGELFGLFDWVESKYHTDNERDSAIRDGLFHGAAEVLADVALGYERDQILKDEDHELWKEEFEAQYNYLDHMFEARKQIPNKIYGKRESRTSEAEELRLIIDSIKFEPASTRDTYLTRKAHELALDHLGISEDQAEDVSGFKDWEAWERGHLKEVVYHTDKKSVHGRKDIRTSRDI